MPSSNEDHVLIEQMVGGPIITMVPGRWGFTNRTDVVTLANGNRMVVQRYRRRKDAEYRLRVMQALSTPAAQSGIAIPTILQFELDTDPPGPSLSHYQVSQSLRLATLRWMAFVSRSLHASWVNCWLVCVSCLLQGFHSRTTGPTQAVWQLARRRGSRVCLN